MNYDNPRTISAASPPPSPNTFRTRQAVKRATPVNLDDIQADKHAYPFNLLIQKERRENLPADWMEGEGPAGRTFYHSRFPKAATPFRLPAGDLVKLLFKEVEKALEMWEVRSESMGLQVVVSVEEEGTMQKSGIIWYEGYVRIQRAESEKRIVPGCVW